MDKVRSYKYKIILEEWLLSNAVYSISNIIFILIYIVIMIIWSTVLVWRVKIRYSMIQK
jgi:hypothetical protein